MRPRFVPALALATLTAGSAVAAPLVKDIDGDGTADKGDVDAAGNLGIQTKQDTSKIALGKLDRPVLSSEIVLGAPTIVVRGEKEAAVVQRAGTQWKFLVRAPVGPVGLDGDYGIEIAALPDGIFRFQTRDGYVR